MERMLASMPPLNPQRGRGRRAQENTGRYETEQGQFPRLQQLAQLRIRRREFPPQRPPPPPPSFRPPEGATVLGLQEHSGAIIASAWQPGSDTLATASNDKTVRLWDVRDGISPGRSRLTLYHHRDGDTSGGDVLTLDWSHDGSLLATGSWDCFGRIWSAEGELSCQIGPHASYMLSCQWSRGDDRLLTVAPSGCKIWLPDGMMQRRISIDLDPLGLAVWRDKHTLASAGTDRLIRVHTVLGKWAPDLLLSGHTGPINALRATSCGRLLASGSVDRTVRIWCPSVPGSNQCITHHTESVTALEWSPRGPGRPRGKLVLASASLDGTVVVWDPETAAPVHIMTLPQSATKLQTMAFTGDGRLLAAVHADNTVFVWCVQMGPPSVRKLGGMTGTVMHLTWDRTGNKLAISLDNGQVCIFDMRM